MQPTHDTADPAYRVLEQVRQLSDLSCKRVKDWRDLSTQVLVLRLPRLDGEGSLLAAEECPRADSRPRIVRQEDQVVVGDDQLIGATNTQHVDPHALFRDDHGVTAVDAERIDGLQPGQRLTFSAQVGTIAPHIHHRSSRLNATQHIPPRQLLKLERQRGLAVDAALLEGAQCGRAQEIHLDWWALAFVIAISTVTGLIAGLIPSLGLHTGQLLESLQSSSRSHSSGRSRARLRKTLLTAEVSLTVVLLLGAGLLLKSYQQLRTRDLGSAVDNVLTMQFSLPDAHYEKPKQKIAFFEQLLARVRALPGVAAAGISSALPGEGWGGDLLVDIPEHPPLPKGQGIDLMHRGADPGYFAALQIPLIRGRYFRNDERLDHGKVAIISESTAKQYFPGEDPIGRHLGGSDVGPKYYEIVGVVGDTRWMITQPMRPTVYLPLFEGHYGGVGLAVRGNPAVDVESLALPIQKIFGQLDPDLPVANVLTMQQNIGVATLQDQFNSILVLAFAIIALVLAAVGLYGVLSYLVTQRTGELGIRIALGAQRPQIMRLTLADGLAPVLIGLILGLAGGAAAVRLLREMLYGMSPFDWSVFSAVVVVLALTAACACMIPAWRASRLDPAQALRTE